MTEEIKKIEDIKKLEEETRENIDLSLVENLLKNHDYEFEYKNIRYRVRKPTFGEKQESYNKRLQKQLSLLAEKDENGNFRFKSEKDIIAIYKERGIDIDEMMNAFTVLEKRKKDLMMKTGKGLKEHQSEAELEVYRKELENVSIEQQKLSFERAKLLELSVETQLDVFTYTYLTYLVSETIRDEEWIRLWNTWEEFTNTPEDIVNKISYFVVLICQNEL